MDLRLWVASRDEAAVPGTSESPKQSRFSDLHPGKRTARGQFWPQGFMSSSLQELLFYSEGLAPKRSENITKIMIVINTTYICYTFFFLYFFLQEINRLTPSIVHG